MTLAKFTAKAGRRIWTATQAVLGEPADLGSVRGRANTPGQFRLALILDAGGGSAVDCSAVEVYKIKLIVGTFIEALGPQELTYTIKEGEYFAAARPGQIFAETDIVAVHWWNNRYWIDELIAECDEAVPFCGGLVADSDIDGPTGPSGKYCTESETQWTPGNLAAEIVTVNNSSGHLLTLLDGDDNGSPYKEITVEYTEGDGVSGFGILIDPALPAVPTGTNDSGYAMLGHAQMHVRNTVEGSLQATAAGFTHLGSYSTRTMEFVSASGGTDYPGGSEVIAVPCWQAFTGQFLTGVNYDDCETATASANPDPRHAGTMVPKVRIYLERAFGVTGPRKVSIRVANIMTKVTRFSHFWSGADPWRTFLTPASSAAITKPAMNSLSDPYHDAEASAAFTANHGYSVVIDYGTRGTITITVDACVSAAGNPGLFFGQTSLPASVRGDGTSLLRWFYLRIATLEANVSYVSTIDGGGSGAGSNGQAGIWVMQDQGAGDVFRQNLAPGGVFTQEQPYGDCPDYFNGDGLTDHTRFGAPHVSSGTVTAQVNVVAT